jgi:hypothetical protein
MGEVTRRLVLTRPAALPVGLQVGVGAAGVLAATIVGAMLPAPAAWWRAAVVAAAVFAFAALRTSAWAVASSAMLGYLLVTGFLINRFGELSWHGWSDASRLLLFGGAAGAGWLTQLHDGGFHSG